MKRPFIVFVFSKEGTDSSTRYGGFARRVQKAGGAPDHDIVTVALENLIFIVREDGTAQVIDSVSQLALGDAAFVYMKSWEAMPEEAAALANYLHYADVPFADSLPLGMGVSKLSMTFRLWGQGIPMPPTVYIRRADRLQTVLRSKPVADILGKRFIVKDILGEKGRLNFIAEQPDVAVLLEKHPDTQFMCQRFVENEGDYRIGVYGERADFVLKRVGSDGSHLNNTSAGGAATQLKVADLPSDIVELAEHAAQACQLQVAGVDIIVDSVTKLPYVLEVNQGSQIVTGAFSEDNTASFAAAINTMVGEQTKLHKPATRTIGRRAIAELPDLSVEKVTAKIDTGAYLSTLHASNIRIEKPEGVPQLVFKIMPLHNLQTVGGAPITIRTSDYVSKTVRSSNGQEEERYAIRTKLGIDGISFPVTITLSDRSQMKYPLLIGRRALRSRFLVNVSFNEENKPGSSQ